MHGSANRSLLSRWLPNTIPLRTMWATGGVGLLLLGLFLIGSGPSGQRSTVFSRTEVDLTGVWDGASALEDVNGDGHLDLIITGGIDRTANATSVYLGDKTGSVQKTESQLPGLKGGDLSVGDVNEDGHLDLLMSGLKKGERQQLIPTTTLFLGDGEGGFRPAEADLEQVYKSASSIADLDGDGHLDLLIAGADTTLLYRGDGTAGFTTAEAGLKGVNNAAMAVGDLNEDDRMDVVLAGTDTSDTPLTAVYLQQKDGSFRTAGASLPGAAGGSISLGDVNGDDNLDVLLTGRDSSSNPLSALYYGDGTGSFTEAEVDITSVMRSSSALADVNGDDAVDVLVAGQKVTMEEGALGEVKEESPAAQLYLNTPSGGFDEPSGALKGVSWSSLSLGDVDEDGDLDLVLTGNSKDESSRTITPPSATLYENVSSER